MVTGYPLSVQHIIKKGVPALLPGSHRPLASVLVLLFLVLYNNTWWDSIVHTYVRMNLNVCMYPYVTQLFQIPVLIISINHDRYIFDFASLVVVIASTNF